MPAASPPRRLANSPEGRRVPGLQRRRRERGPTLASRLVLSLALTRPREDRPSSIRRGPCWPVVGTRPEHKAAASAGQRGPPESAAAQSPASALPRERTSGALPSHVSFLPRLPPLSPACPARRPCSGINSCLPGPPECRCRSHVKPKSSPSLEPP